VLGLVLVDPVADHSVGDLVGHLLAGVRVALGLDAEQGALRDVGAEDVAVEMAGVPTCSAMNLA
jgi:hypothetical protein